MKISLKTKFYQTRAAAEKIASELREGEILTDTAKSEQEAWSYLVEAASTPGKFVIQVFDENADFVGCWTEGD